MAKQNRITGVVQAAQAVSATQGRFVDYAKAFTTGVESAINKRKEQERAIKEAKQKAASKFKETDVEFDLGGFGLSDQEVQIVSNFSIGVKKELSEKQSAYNLIEDKTSPEAIKLSSEMNKLRMKPKNLQKILQSRKKLQIDHLTDANGNNEMLAGYSGACQNQDDLNNLYTIVGEPFTSVNTKGEPVWENGLTMQEFRMPFPKANEAINTLIDQQKKATRKETAFNETELEIIGQELDGIFDNASNISSMISGDYPWYQSKISDDLKARWDQAVEQGADLTELKEEFKQVAVDALQETANKTAKVEEPDPEVGEFDYLRSSSKKKVEYFESNAVKFEIDGTNKIDALAHDAKGNAAIDSEGMPNPKYKKPPAFYLLGKFKNGVFVQAEGKERIPAGNVTEFVRIAGL